jgi:hypothetical protein
MDKRTALDGHAAPSSIRNHTASSMRLRLLVLATIFLLIVLLVWAMRASVFAQGTATVSGFVVTQDGAPVAGAVVRQQTTTNHTTSAVDGSFTLDGLTEGITTTITAWQEGYLVGWAEVMPPKTGVTITLNPHYTTDNPDYPWFSSNDPEGPVSCVHCMVAHPQWRANAHGNSGTNPRFFSLYNGTDITGTTTITPGYKLDFPGTAGNCATCHAPAAAVRGMRTHAAADMNELQGVEPEGVFCEFCHKAGAVYLNPATALPYPNAPGVLSMRLYRPTTGGAEQLFFGPFDDVTRRVSYSALEKQSQFCAPCHQFSFWGTPIYESFREWLESPYPAQGIECQTCHMKPTGVDYFVFPEKGGLIRDPQLIASHLQPGAADEELLQNTVNMTVSARQAVDRLQVTVTITNTEAGHHVPTDYPGRHMILTVTAMDEEGEDLAQLAGPTVPQWGGEQAGLPGTAFAKVLRDVETGESPVVNYWKQALIVSDNRIPALGSDASAYIFAAPRTGGLVTVKTELRFRRVFQDMLDLKGWDTPDIMMEEERIVLPVQPWETIFLPIVQRSTGS